MLKRIFIWICILGVAAFTQGPRTAMAQEGGAPVAPGLELEAGTEKTGEEIDTGFFAMIKSGGGLGVLLSGERWLSIHSSIFVRER